MKNVLRTHRYLITVLVILGCAAAFSFAQKTKQGDGSGKVEIYGEIVVHPTIQLSKNDQDKLDHILANADKSFYKTTKFGANVETKGDLQIATAIEQEVKDAVEKKLHGFCVEFVPTGGPAGQNVMSHLTTDQQTFLDKITPILKKY